MNESNNKGGVVAITCDGLEVERVRSRITDVHYEGAATVLRFDVFDVAVPDEDIRRAAAARLGAEHARFSETEDPGDEALYNLETERDELRQEAAALKVQLEEMRDELAKVNAQAIRRGTERALLVEHREIDETPVVRAIAVCDLGEALAQAIFGSSVADLDPDHCDQLERYYLPQMREISRVTFEGDPPLSLHRVSDLVEPCQDWLAAKDFLVLHEVGTETVCGGVERLLAERDGLAEANRQLAGGNEALVHERNQARNDIAAGVKRAKLEATRLGLDESRLPRNRERPRDRGEHGVVSTMDTTNRTAKGPMTCGDVLRKLGTCTSIEHGQWALDELHRLGMAHQSMLADMREQLAALRRADGWQLAQAQADELDEWIGRLADIETPVGEDDPGFSLASLAEAMRQLQGERDQALFALAGHEAAAVDRGAPFNIRSISITIDYLPQDHLDPLSLAKHGEELGAEANGADHPSHPSARAWARAGCAASAILRAHDGTMSADLLVALLAGNADPRGDESSPDRARIIGGYRGLARREFRRHEYGGVRFHAEIDGELRLCDARLGDQLHVWIGGYIHDDLDGVDGARREFARCYLDLDGFRDGDARPFDEVLAALEAGR